MRVQAFKDLHQLTIRVELITRFLKVAVIGKGEGYACCCGHVEGKVDWVCKVLPTKQIRITSLAKRQSQLTSPVSTAPLPEDQVPDMLETLFAVVKSCCAKTAAGTAKRERNAKVWLDEYMAVYMNELRVGQNRVGQGQAGKRLGVQSWRSEEVASVFRLKSLKESKIISLFARQNTARQRQRSSKAVPEEFTRCLPLRLEENKGHEAT